MDCLWHSKVKNLNSFPPKYDSTTLMVWAWDRTVSALVSLPDLGLLWKETELTG